jgi:hypothetical protein
MPRAQKGSQLYITAAMLGSASLLLYRSMMLMTSQLAYRSEDALRAVCNDVVVAVAASRPAGLGQPAVASEWPVLITTGLWC